MKQLLSNCFLIYLFGCISLATAQLDNPNGTSANGISIGTIKAPVKEVKKPMSLEFGNDNGFKTANTKLEKKHKEEQQERALEVKGIITPQMTALKNAKKNIEGNFQNFPMIDMDLGSFHTLSKNVFLSSYDFGRFDGDKVQITVNGKRIHNNYLLTPRLKTMKIPLSIGINKIEVTAINEGKLSPNTGYFAFFDNKRSVIKEGEWMLAKGAKVIAIIVRDQK